MVVQVVLHSLSMKITLKHKQQLMVKMDQHIWVDKLLVNLLVINLNKMVQHQLLLVKQIVFSVETLASIPLKILLEDSLVKLDLLLL
jgi:hypothetical protein